MSVLTDPALVICPACGAPNRVPGARLGQHPSCGRCKAPLFAGKPVDADFAAFERHVGRGSLPVLVDFWAEWCGPCKAMAPAYAQAAGLLEPHVRLLKVDTERVPELAQRYQNPLDPDDDPVQGRKGGGADLGRDASASHRPVGARSRLRQI